MNSQRSVLEFVTEDRHINYALDDNAELYVIKAFYPATEADRLYDVLFHQLAWQEEDIRIFGKWVKVPRLMCWYGDVGTQYTYSGVNHQPLPWHPELLAIKETIERQCDCIFNSVLANLYRDGNDSMGCHADDEPELGINPTIASLSLGADRRFKMHHKKTKQSFTINLQHGDLLAMGGACQQFWLHSVPKTKALTAPRINLTYRKIIIC